MRRWLAARTGTVPAGPVGRSRRHGLRLAVVLSLLGAAMGLGAPSASAVCITEDYTATLTATVGVDVFQTQTWPGSNVVLGPPGCEIRLTAPSGNINIVGVVGDSWSATPLSGSQIGSVSVVSVGPTNEGLDPPGIPNCTSPASTGAYTKTNGDFGRPSCSSGIFSGTGSTATITVRAHANPVLTVSVSGPGTVTGTPGGISCPGTCQAQASIGDVTLVATPTPGNHFTGWTGIGGCDPSPRVCTLPLVLSTSVTANFAAGPPPVCLQADYTVTMTASVGSDPLQTQSWPGGKVSAGPPGCVVTITRPSSTITLAGATGDSWSASVPADSGVDSVTLLSSGPNGQGQWGTPNCSTAGALGSYTVTAQGGWGRPSCTVGFFTGVGSTANIVIRAFPKPVLTVSKTGNGTGTVTSGPAGIDCGPTCSAQFATGTSVTLTAVPSVGSIFTGWSAAGCPGTGTCVVPLGVTQSVTATFIRPTLTVAKSGSASGTVTSNPAGISCGATCAAVFNAGAPITLTAVPAAGATFAGWLGGGCTGTGTCQLTLNASTTVTAAFTQNPAVTVTRAGTGTGVVTSTPAGVNCGATCLAEYPPGTVVTLTASPTGGSTFAGWSGACTGAGACVLTMTASKAVTATFTAPTVTVAKTGAGAGTVTSAPAGIDCGATCSAQFATGTSVTLTAVPAAGSTFTGWSGGGCSGTGTCQVTVNANTTVTASFAPPATLTVARTGTGTVTSSPAGIDCGATCSASFGSGTSVTLTAAAGAGFGFTGWSGGGCTGTGTCTVVMSAATTVTATFTATVGPQGTTPTLTVVRAGTGTGTVTSAPAGIACGAACSAQLPAGTSVTLTAAPAAGSTFAGWSGGGCTGKGTCVVALAADTSVTATFTLTPRPDGLIAIGTKAFVGNNAYNTTGLKQTRAAKGKPGATVSFRWSVQNDARGADTLVLKATANRVAGFEVRYFAGKKNVTGAVKTGTFSATLAAGKAVTLRVTVKVLATAKAGAVSKLGLTARSKADRTKTDTVRATTTAA